MNGNGMQKLRPVVDESKAESVDYLIHVNTFGDSGFRRMLVKQFAL